MTTPLVHSTAVGAMKFGDHLCLPYDNHDERNAVLAAFVHDGLAQGHKVVYVSDGQSAESVLGWLGDDFTEAVERDDLVIQTAEEAYMATGSFDPDEIVKLFGTELELAMIQGHKGLRLTCEKKFSLRGWPGSERFAEFEEKIEFIFQNMPVNAMALCQYDPRWFGRRPLEHLLGVHQRGNVRVDDVYDDGVLRIAPTFTPPGLALHGAVEESTFPALLRALADLGDETGHLCLDLAGLEFCDMAGLRTIIGSRTTDEGRERQILLRNPRREILDLLSMAGWEQLPGVFVEEN